MKLYFKDDLIGYVRNIHSEGSWNYGSFEGNEKFQDFKDFFKEITCENGFDESKFESEFLNDMNWMLNHNGNIIGIYFPAIYDDGEIAFKYR